MSEPIHMPHRIVIVAEAGNRNALEDAVRAVLTDMMDRGENAHETIYCDHPPFNVTYESTNDGTFRHMEVED